jgi:hypothetical protein
MAAELDIKEILRVDKDTEVTLGMIRQKIAELRQELLNMNEGSAEYVKNAREINVLQKEMSSVMDASKKYTVDAAGSFNALTAELRQLKEEWKATADPKVREKLTADINVIKAQLNDFNHDIGNYQDNVGNYTNSIVDAFTKMGISVSSLTAPLKKVGVDIEGMDTSIKILIGPVKRFTGQNLVALKSGLVAASVGAKSFIVSLSGIQKALLATGIGAFIVLLGVLIAHWDDLTGKVKENTAAIERNRQAQEDLNIALEDDATAMEIRLGFMEAEGKSRLEILETQIKMYEQTLANARATYEEAAAAALLIEGEEEREAAYKRLGQMMSQIEGLTKSLTKARIAWAVETKKSTTTVQKAGRAAGDDEKKLLDEALKNIDTEVNAVKRATDEIVDEQSRRMKAAHDLATEIEQEGWTAVERENFQYEQRKKILKEFGISTETLERVHQKNLSDIIKNEALQRLDEAKQRLDDEYNLEERRRAISLGGTPEGETGIAAAEEAEKQAQEDYDRFKKYSDAKIETNLEQMKQLEEGSEEWTKLDIENSELRIEQANKEAEVKNRNKDKEDKINKARQQAYKNMAQGTADILKNMSTALGENTKLGKGFAIAAATIDTIAAAVAGFRAGMNQWADAGPLAYMAPIQAALNAAMALTAGFAEVQKIASVDTSGNATSSGGGSTASAIAIPNIEGLSSPVDYTRQVTTETEQEEMNQNNRVYILESDIQESGNRVKVREEETTF